MSQPNPCPLNLVKISGEGSSQKLNFICKDELLGYFSIEFNYYLPRFSLLKHL
jgi:hypothetical protein